MFAFWTVIKTSRLILIFYFLLHQEYIRNEMFLVLFYWWGFDLLECSVHHHFLAHFVKTFEIQHAFSNTLKKILAPKHIGDSSFLGNGLNPNILIHNQRTIPKDIHRQRLFRRFNLPNLLQQIIIVVCLFNININTSTINDNYAPLFLFVFDEEFFVGLVDEAD